MNVSKMNNRFLVIGRAGVDLYAAQEKADLSSVTSFSRNVGGSAANIAVALGRQDAEVKLGTNLADDEWGSYIKGYLLENNVKLVGSLVKSPKRNSLAITEIKQQSQVVFYRHDPADMSFSPNDLTESAVEKSDALILTGTAFSASPSRETVFVSLHYAEKYGKYVFLDLDYRPSGWQNQHEIFVYYSLVMEKCDTLIGTEEEFHEVLNFLRTDKSGKKKGKFSDRQIASHFLKNKTKCVIIKKGADGSVAFTRNSQADKSSDKLEVTKGGIFKVKVKKNFGAGDAFAGFFCRHWMKTQSLEEALKRGAAAAAIVVSRDTCTEAMPRARELSAFMKKNNYKIN